MRVFIFVLCILTLMSSCNYKENVNTEVDNSTYTDSIGKFTIDTLLSMGLSIETSHFKISKLAIKDFKGSKLPLAICASFSKNGFGQLDSLMILIGNEKQKIMIRRDDYEMSSPDAMLRIESDINLKDYNFDGVPDISIYSTQSGMKNIMETIFIYDREMDGYYKNEILSQSSNCKIDSVSKTISTFGQGGMASMIFNSELYNWENNKLHMIKSVSQDYIDELDRFVRITKTMINQEWITQVDTLSEAQLLEMRDDHN